MAAAMQQNMVQQNLVHQNLAQQMAQGRPAPVSDVRRSWSPPAADQRGRRDRSRDRSRDRRIADRERERSKRRAFSDNAKKDPSVGSKWR